MAALSASFVVSCEYAAGQGGFPSHATVVEKRVWVVVCWGCVIRRAEWRPGDDQGYGYFYVLEYFVAAYFGVGICERDYEVRRVGVAGELAVL